MGVDAIISALGFSGGAGFGLAFPGFAGSVTGFATAAAMIGTGLDVHTACATLGFAGGTG